MNHKKVKIIVHNLRSQPLETRKMILVVGSFGLTALIMLLWISAFALKSEKYTAPIRTEKPTESPFSMIKDSVVELYANASKGFDSAINE